MPASLRNRGAIWFSFRDGSWFAQAIARCRAGIVCGRVKSPGLSVSPAFYPRRAGGRQRGHQIAGFLHAGAQGSIWSFLILILFLGP